MISNFFLFSFLTLSCFYSVISREIYLDCYYSKYLLYNLNTKVIYFNKIVSVNKQNHILIENFAMGLQFSGPIVEAMLRAIYDEHMDKEREIMKTNQLWSINAFKNSQGLLYANFYFNNLYNTLLLQTYQNVTTETIELSDHEIFIDEFKKIYPILIEQLKQNVLDACYKGKQMNFPNIVTQNQSVDRNYSNNVIINDLLPTKETIKTIFIESNIEQTMNDVGDTEVNLRYHFSIKIDDEIMRNTKYHPNAMLFSNLFHESKIYKLSGIIEVRVNEKLENGEYPNMAVLFDMIKHTFDVDCVESFQRQIVAATVYPVYYCVAKFTLLLKKIIFGNDTNESKVTSRVQYFEENLRKTSFNITYIIDQLSRKPLPSKVKDHIEITGKLFQEVAELANSKKFSDLRLDTLDSLYWRCARPMEFNLIHFDTGVSNPNMYKKKDCNKYFSQLKDKIYDVKSLLPCIEDEFYTYYYFSTRLQVFSFDYIFSGELKCNIVQRNKKGYNIIKNK